MALARFCFIGDDYLTFLEKWVAWMDEKSIAALVSGSVPDAPCRLARAVVERAEYNIPRNFGRAVVAFEVAVMKLVKEIPKCHPFAPPGK